jgi:hypothetical protein
MGLFVGILARIMSPKISSQSDGKGHVVMTTYAWFPPRRKLGPQADSGPTFQLRIVYEEPTMLAPQLSGKANDFVANRRGQWI